MVRCQPVTKPKLPPQCFYRAACSADAV